jgi:Skp family chaperone for outer membrane proteins/predicted RNA-binding Zn-ribbon protein involved in translation (DUF1610 family)
MTTPSRPRGSWTQRFFIILLSIVFGVLFFWLLSFVTSDIGTIQGPSLAGIEAKYVEQELLGRKVEADVAVAAKRREIENLQQRQRILKDGTNSLQETIKQLLDIRRLSLERNTDLSAEDLAALADSQKMFLENQKQYQVLNEHMVGLAEEQRRLESELAAITEQIQKQRRDAQREYAQLHHRHMMKVAALKLGFLLPVFVICTWFLSRRRGGTFAPIFYAAFVAVFVKVFLVIHEHFPTEYFKYIALGVAIGIVLGLLTYLLRMVVRPSKVWLVRQYREAYDKGLCPICSKPIRTGPLRYIGWVRRRQEVSFQPGGQMDKYEVYICPSCGTRLYEECPGCRKVRHSLLPFCENCGNIKELSAETTA